jgi:hypothetical protein
MKPVDTTAKDVRELFNLIHHYDMNYDRKNVNRYQIRENTLNLIKSMILFAWTDEADILHPTELQINQFVIHGMQVNIKSTGEKEKITIEVSIDYQDERLSVVLVDYI